MLSVLAVLAIIIVVGNIIDVHAFIYIRVVSVKRGRHALKTGAELGVQGPQNARGWLEKARSVVLLRVEEGR